MIAFPSRILPGLQRWLLSSLPAAALMCAAGCGPRPKLYLRDPGFELADSSKTVLVVPVDTITVIYFDETKPEPDTQFTDSFFLETANSLLAFEAMKRYTLKELPEADEGRDSLLDKLRDLRSSHIEHAGGGANQAAGTITQAAKQFGVDLILLTYSCTLRHILFQPRPWRGGGPSYEKPVTFRASCATHVQIWNAKGVLLYERVGTSDAGRPIMYSLFGKKEPGQDLVKFAKHIYAPPLVRSLYASIQNALKTGR